MPSIAGKYQHYKNEDIEEYFTAVGQYEYNILHIYKNILCTCVSLCNTV